jgi:hypothetical protein
MPDKPDDTDPIEIKINWLLNTHGYDARADRVVMLYEPSHYCTMVLKAFQTLYMPWWIEETGPQGGVKRKHAFAAWMLHADRYEIAGVRLRPDMPFPCYWEDGQLFKNTYRRPQHTATGGSVDLWIKFMEHLIPDQTEREWFYDWLAYKYQNPHIPGVAVIMVAAGIDGPVYGAGRGKLKEILSRLMGPRYVKPIDFDLFAGKSGQADYTDWAAYATLVVVSESKDTLESGKWAAQRAVYERVKEIVDPRPVLRTFTMKNRQAFEAIAFTSYLIFSNNFDPLQIPDNDRRVTAIANGVQMTPEMAQALDEWMEEPANIAELGRWLESSDLTGFNPYAPLKTATKSRMQAMSRSEFDDAVADVRRIVGSGGLFTRPQIQTAVLARMDGGDGVNLASMVRSQIRRVTTEAPSEVELRVDVGGQPRQRVYCWIGYAGPKIRNKEGAAEMVKATAKQLETGEPGNPKDMAAAMKRAGFGVSGTTDDD